MARDLTLMALKRSIGPMVALIVGSFLVGFLAVVAYGAALRAGLPRLVAVAAPVLVVGVAVVGYLVVRGD